MKNKLFIAIIFNLGILQIKSSIAQSNKNSELNCKCKEILSEMVFFKTYKLKNVGISVIIFNNPSGSANIPETDEVSSNIIVIKSEYGENESPQYFYFNNIYNPKIISVSENKVDITFKDKQKKSLILN
jgi:hypothetical protein